MEGFRKLRAGKNPNPISGVYKLLDNQTLDMYSLHANWEEKIQELIQNPKHH